MAAITITDTNPAITKATGGGGRGSATETDPNPTHTEAAGGGRTYVTSTDLSPLIDGIKTPPGLPPGAEEIMNR